MKARKQRDAFAGINFSALGQAIVDEAKRICHQRHLDGEFDPSWQSCLQLAQKVVVPKFMNVKQEGEEGRNENGNGKGSK
jgi:hypothetical protein